MHKKFANFKTEIFRSFLLLKKINDFVVVGLGRFLDYLNHDFLDLKRTRKCFVFFYVRKIDKNLNCILITRTVIRKMGSDSDFIILPQLTCLQVGVRR